MSKSKNRGIWLSVWLILMVLHAILMFFLVRDATTQGYAEQSWITAALAITSLAIAISAVAIWFWKKWGLYLYGIAIIVEMALGVILTGSVWFILYDIIPPVILGYLIREKWDDFGL